MRAFVMEGFGPAEKGALGNLPKPAGGPGDLLVRIASAGINPSDWKEMEGRFADFYPSCAPRWAPGVDGAGLVEEVGEGIRDFKRGDRVMLMSDRRGGQCGTFAEYVRVSEKLAAKAPASISLSAAGSIPIAGLTAYQALVREDMGALKRAQRVLVHGAAGGIGSFATGFADALGTRVAGTCRASNAEYVRELGAELAIDYTRGQIAADLREWEASGVDLVIDAVSGGRQSELFDALAPGGRWVIVATLTHDADIAALSAEGQRRGCSVHYLILDHLRAAEDLRAIARLIDEGGMRMPAITRYPLERTGEALEAMQAGRIRGKLLIDVADLG